MDTFVIDQKTIHSRLWVGSAAYPSPKIMQQAIRQAAAGIITVSLRRETRKRGDSDDFFHMIQQVAADMGAQLLPNTAGCYSARDAITTAKMARELFQTHWVKLEVISNEYQLNPDPYGLLEAATELISQGFEVFPYCTDDLAVAEKLVALGCRVIMPWAAPIGTGKGLLNAYGLKTLRHCLPDTLLIVDAGIGKPSQAAQVLEMGFDGVLINTAIAKAVDAISMADAFRLAVQSGRIAYRSGMIAEQDIAKPSTPTLGTPFWQQNT